MKNERLLSPAEHNLLSEFVLDVLNVIKYDDTGVTDDLIESAQIAAEILGINSTEEEED